MSCYVSPLRSGRCGRGPCGSGGRRFHLGRGRSGIDRRQDDVGRCGGQRRRSGGRQRGRRPAVHWWGWGREGRKEGMHGKCAWCFFFAPTKKEQLVRKYQNCSSLRGWCFKIVKIAKVTLAIGTYTHIHTISNKTRRLLFQLHKLQSNTLLQLLLLRSAQKLHVHSMFSVINAPEKE